MEAVMRLSETVSSAYTFVSFQFLEAGRCDVRCFTRSPIRKSVFTQTLSYLCSLNSTLRSCPRLLKQGNDVRQLLRGKFNFVGTKTKDRLLRFSNH